MLVYLQELLTQLWQNLAFCSSHLTCPFMGIFSSLLEELTGWCIKALRPEIGEVRK